MGSGGWLAGRLVAPSPPRNLGDPPISHIAPSQRKVVCSPSSPPPSPLRHHPGECRVCALLGRAGSRLLAGASYFPWQPACQPQPGPLQLWRLEDRGTDTEFGLEKAGAVLDGLAWPDRHSEAPGVWKSGEKGDRDNQQLIKSPCSHLQPCPSPLPCTAPEGIPPSSASNFLVAPAPLPPVFPDLVPREWGG